MYVSAWLSYSESFHLCYEEGGKRDDRKLCQGRKMRVRRRAEAVKEHRDIPIKFILMSRLLWEFITEILDIVRCCGNIKLCELPIKVEGKKAFTLLHIETHKIQKNRIEKNIFFAFNANWNETFILKKCCQKVFVHCWNLTTKSHIFLTMESYNEQAHN